MSDVETRIQQIAQVLGQLDDTQMPRNIRASAKEAVEQWLLNKGKDMDVRLGMTASKLDDIFNDCLLYTSPSPRDLSTSRMPSSA